jgi:hypothetical protein
MLPKGDELVDVQVGDLATCTHCREDIRVDGFETEYEYDYNSDGTVSDEGHEILKPNWRHIKSGGIPDGHFCDSTHGTGAFPMGHIRNEYPVGYVMYSTGHITQDLRDTDDGPEHNICSRCDKEIGYRTHYRTPDGLICQDCEKKGLMPRKSKPEHTSNADDTIRLREFYRQMQERTIQEHTIENPVMRDMQLIVDAINSPTGKTLETITPELYRKAFEELLKPFMHYIPSEPNASIDERLSILFRDIRNYLSQNDSIPSIYLMKVIELLQERLKDLKIYNPQILNDDKDKTEKKKLPDEPCRANLLD